MCSPEKGSEFGGSLVRPEATVGYGGLYFVREMLADKGIDTRASRVAISGFGNVAWGAAQKATQMGAKVVTISGPDGYIYDEDGLTKKRLLTCWNFARAGTTFAARMRNASRGLSSWQAAVRGSEVRYRFAVCYTKRAERRRCPASYRKRSDMRGRNPNMGCTPEAIDAFIAHKMLYAPGKGCQRRRCSHVRLEMSQNAMHLSWSAEEVDRKLHAIMHGIHEQCVIHAPWPALSAHVYAGFYDRGGREDT